jgi:hypothetical protein
MGKWDYAADYILGFGSMEVGRLSAGGQVSTASRLAKARLVALFLRQFHGSSSVLSG